MSTKHPKQEVKPRGYRVTQWCEAFQSSRATAYKMMADGRLPYVVIGGRRFITNDAADALLETGETAS
jgi:predicted site-specific integrase-resolvase